MAGPPPPAPASPTPTVTRTPAASRTPSMTPSVTVSPSRGAPPPSLSRTPSITPSISPSISITPSITRTPSITPSLSVSPSIPATPSVTPTPSRSPYCNQGGLLAQMQVAAINMLQTAVGYYKIDLSKSRKNIYGESLEKWYNKPVLAKCVIERDPDAIRDELFGPDIEKNIRLTFPKAVFEEYNSDFPYEGVGLNFLPEIGDIIYERSLDRYFEVHNIIIDYQPYNSNLGASISCPPVELVTYHLECHHTRASKLNLLPDKLL